MTPVIHPRAALFVALALSASALAACGDDGGHAGLVGDTADTLGGGDSATAEDAADTAVPDVAPLPEGPLAKVYSVSPTETPELTEVELAHLSSSDGTLVGDYARVRACVKDLEAGAHIPLDFGGFQLDLVACVPSYVARADARGTYLDVAPPATPEEDDGSFAEVMMYHHMQVVHDYFKDVHGLTDRDSPLDALTNLQAHVDLCDQWAPFPNAAFIPKESISELPFGIGAALGLEGDAIVFSGTDAKNFAFDASVIYHEYTHSILGATRLNGVFLDEQGLNNLPGALNEAYADYFSATITERHVLGTYSLNDLGSFQVCGVELGGGGNQARDLVNDLRCPRDLTAEVHADSELFSAALWAIRGALGKGDADAVILQGVLELTNASDFTVAAEATIDAARTLIGEGAEATVRAAFEDRGLIDCPRVLPVAAVGARGLAVTVPAVADLGGADPFGGWLPGYVQYQVEVPEGARSLEIAVTTQSGGLFGGGGTVDLELAFKAGAAPITYALPRTGSGSSDAVVTVALDANKEAVLAGGCLTAGTWTFAIHNRGDGVAISKIVATTSAEEPASTNFDVCE